MTPHEAAAHVEEARRRNDRALTAEAREDQWLEWAARLREDEVEDGGDDPHGEEILAAGLAELQDWIDAQLAGNAEAARREAGALQRRLSVAESARAAERRRRTVEAAADRKRITQLEEQTRTTAVTIEVLHKEMAGLQREVARDRSLRRLADARRAYPHADKLALERARMRTQAAVEGRSENG